MVGLSRDRAALEAVRGTIEQAGGRAGLVVCDVADLDALAGAIEGVAKEHGRLDILVNNAGVTRDNLVLRMSLEDWETVLRVDLTAAFVAIRSASRYMMRARYGRIVNIGSTSATIGNAGQANYAAAKAGLEGLTRTVAREFGAKGITCNLLAPGWVETDMTASLPAEVREAAVAMTVVKRLASPDDIAAAVEFLCSEQAGYITGQTLCVDGGMTMR